MSTVGKAIKLLEAFDIERPELGLTELARACDFDKATTRRLLLSLAQHGLIEQDDITRRYRLGPALVRFASVREAHFPFIESSRGVVLALAEETGETVHLSEFDGGYLTSTYVAESSRANRVSVSVGDRLPLHATASGLAYLAAAPEEYVEAYLQLPLEKFTPLTLSDPELLRQKLLETRTRGYSVGDQGRAEGVFSVGAAILDNYGNPIGAIAIASPSVRVGDGVSQIHGMAVHDAARQVSLRLFGQAPQHRSRTGARSKDRAL
jgi:IclR family transcriptional regulator, acetate operon repressor